MGVSLREETDSQPNCDFDLNFYYRLGCLGALDGTYIEAKVPEVDKPRNRNRKGQVFVNVLGVCDTNMKFVYVLPGWEGSAADSRVLRDAISRTNGLKIPKGNNFASLFNEIIFVILIAPKETIGVINILWTFVEISPVILLCTSLMKFHRSARTPTHWRPIICFP
ncbi:hypothetical protein ACS0TY_013879 [Phlomoides rotata]